MPNPIGEGTLRIAAFPLGFHDVLGRVVGASSRADFPTQTETLLLQFAVNQAVIGVQESRRAEESRRVKLELDSRVAERAAQLDDENAGLDRWIAERTGIEEERFGFESLVQNSSDFIGLASLEGRLLFINRAGQALLGFNGDEQVRTLTILDVVSEEERGRIEQTVLPEVLRTSFWHGEMAFRHAVTGVRVPVAQDVFSIRRHGDESPVALGTIARDITQRRRSDAELIAIKDEFDAELDAMTRLHEFGALLLTNADLPTILDEALGGMIALQHADFGIAQVSAVHANGFYVAAQRGFRQEFLSMFGTTPDPRTVCGRSLLERKRIVVEDIELDERFGALREAAREAGFRGVLATPLFSRDGEAIGVISTHFSEPHRPSERELRLIDLYAQQVGVLIQRKRTEEALRRSEFYLAEGQKLSHTGSWG